MKTSPIRSLKRTAWRRAHPLIIRLRKTWVYKKFLPHNKRQDFHLGWLAPGHKPEHLFKHLTIYGFEHQPIAWLDPGEVMSVRKHAQEIYQYHLRIFSDGEIRGHFEYTPEDYSFRHLLEIGLENRYHEFIEFLGSYHGFIKRVK